MSVTALVHPKITSPTRVKKGLLALQDRVYDRLFRFYLPPGAFALTDGKADLALVNGVTPCVQFPTGEDSGAYATVEVHDFIVAGELHVDVLYTGTSNTNDFNVTVSVTGLSDGTAVDAGTESVSDTSVSPPGTAKDLMVVTLSPFSLNQLDEAFVLSVKRNGASESPANSGDFQVVGVKARFYASQV